jgi:hypothetical protein
MLERVFAVASVLFVAQTNAFTPALRQPLRLRTQPLDAIPTQELIVPVGGAPDVLGSLPSLVVAGAGELGNSQVLLETLVITIMRLISVALFEFLLSTWVA